MPARVVISVDKSATANDLPKSATCANTLYLPMYPSVDVFEAKLRYAVYNCVAIDTDTAPR